MSTFHYVLKSLYELVSSQSPSKTWFILSISSPLLLFNGEIRLSKEISGLLYISFSICFSIPEVICFIFFITKNILLLNTRFILRNESKYFRFFLCFGKISAAIFQNFSTFFIFFSENLHWVVIFKVNYKKKL